MSRAPAPASEPTPWALIAVLYLTGLIAAGQFAKVSLTLGALAAEYPGAPVAFAVSGVAVIGILFGVYAGGITASIGPRRAILAALSLPAPKGRVRRGSRALARCWQGRGRRCCRHFRS